VSARMRANTWGDQARSMCDAPQQRARCTPWHTADIPCARDLWPYLCLWTFCTLCRDVLILFNRFCTEVLCWCTQSRAPTPTSIAAVMQHASATSTEVPKPNTCQRNADDSVRMICDNPRVLIRLHCCAAGDQKATVLHGMLLESSGMCRGMRIHRSGFYSRCVNHSSLCMYRCPPGCTPGTHSAPSLV
jgi:hypothetical protein